MFKKITRCLLISACIFFTGEFYFRLGMILNIANVQFVSVKETREKKRDLQFSQNQDLSILVIGASKLMGLGVNEEEKFSTLLLKNLKIKFPSLKIEVLDTTVNALNIYQKWAVFDSFMKKNNKPSYIILDYEFQDFYHGQLTPSNKPIYLPMKSKEGPDGHAVFRRNWWRKSELLSFVIPRLNIILKANGIYLKGTDLYYLRNEAYLPENPPWVITQQYLIDIQKRCQDHNIRLIVHITPDFHLLPINPYEPASKIFHKFCADHEIQVLDRFDDFKAYKFQDLALSKFDGHPNYLAHKIMADYAVNVIAEDAASRFGAHGF